MFRTAELGRTLGKQEFDAEEERLRPQLIEAQQRCVELGIPLVVVVGGVDGAGKSTLVKSMMEWLDPRRIDVHALERPREEPAHPYYWRFWHRLPRRGRTAIFLGSWYTGPIVRRVYEQSDEGDFLAALGHANRFEKLLTEDGWPVVKLWMHLAKKKVKKRLEALEADKLTRFRVTKQDWKNYRKYDRFREVCERALRETSTGEAPWHVIEASCERYRTVQAFEVLLEVMRGRIAEVEERAGRKRAVKREAPPEEIPTDTILDTLDLGLALPKAKYKKRLRELQNKLNRLAREVYESERSAVFVFEGCDAAGKGGAIRRAVQGMHPKTYRIIPVAAPNEEERSFPYLWRFWRSLPRDGKIAIFDRSWYGRVLVERVEGFCDVEDWRRAFSEIREFEEQLRHHGLEVVKFWLQISQEEQLRRFEEREKVAYKRWKITDEDWRNREKWPHYKTAVHEMIERTEADHAPWILVEAEDKLHARIKVLENVAAALERVLDAK